MTPPLITFPLCNRNPLCDLGSPLSAGCKLICQFPEMPALAEDELTVLLLLPQPVIRNDTVRQTTIAANLVLMSFIPSTFS